LLSRSDENLVTSGAISIAKLGNTCRCGERADMARTEPKVIVANHMLFDSSLIRGDRDVVEVAMSTIAEAPYAAVQN